MEPTDHNLRAWEDAHRREATERARLPDPVRHSLRGVDGKRVLHLEYGDAAETLELAALGALVTATTTAPPAREQDDGVLWVQAVADALPAELRRSRFDLVYSGFASLQRVHDLGAWAHGVHDALRGGGDLLVFDAHPVEDAVDPLLHWRGDYFGGDWRLGQVVTAVARAGLVVRALEEYPVADRRVPGAFLLHARRPA